MRVPGLKRLRMAGRWVRSRFTYGAIVLGYHRIADASSDPYSICVSPHHFAQQLDEIRKHARPITLQRLLECMRQGNIPPRSVVLTFDDGYSDIFYNARPLLEHYEIPSTVFAVSGSLGRRFWWDELAHAVHSARSLRSTLHLNVHDEKRVLRPDLSAPNPRGRFLLQLYRLMLPLTENERRPLLDDVLEWAGARPEQSPAYRAASVDELRTLAACPLFEIGAHTASHPVLARLPAARQRKEIQGCKSSLEELLGQKVASFAYPNGSWSVDSPGLLQESGFTSACTSLNDVVSATTNPFLLPRFWVQDWHGDAFSRWLRVWLA